MIIDFPASFFALLLGGFIQKLVPIPTVNTISVIHMDTIIRHTILAASILILGGMQWYCIGWFISKIKSKMKKQGIK
jgi:hypothetical protein